MKAVVVSYYKQNPCQDYFIVTRLLILPSFSIVISTMSPCFRYLGSAIDIATPAGVPVEIMSPASIVIILLKLDTILLIGITIFRLEEFCRISSLTLVTMVRFWGSFTSSFVVIHGPHGANVSMPLPLVNCLSLNCISLADTSCIII